MKQVFLALLPAAFLAVGACKSSKQACIDESKINRDAVCIQIYDPVCGCDGKTYGNSCVAENAGLTSYTKGECQ